MSLLHFSRLLPEETPLSAVEENGGYADRTYSMDLGKNSVGGFCEGKNALRQRIFKILATEKGVYPIYSSAYGIALEDLRGVDAPIAESELKRRISEALEGDDRIASVGGFVFRREGDTLRVTFRVIAEEEEIQMEWSVEGL